MSNIGFIGLGIMGKPMAANLIKGGHTLFLHSRSGVPQELTAAGGKACASAKEVAQKSDIVITMVPDTPDVEKVLFGANGVAEGLSQGQDRDRHELDLADRDQEVREAHQRARLRIRRRAGVRRRSRREERRAHHHGRRQPGDLRQGEAGVRADGQEHHAGGRQRRRPDLQGVQPDHRRAQHRGGERSAGVRLEGRRRSGQGAPGADGRLRRLAHPRSARRAHDQAHLRSGIPDRTASEGPEPRARRARARWASALPNTATAQELFNSCVASGGAKWDHSAMVRALEKLANHPVAG